MKISNRAVVLVFVAMAITANVLFWVYRSRATRPSALETAREFLNFIHDNDFERAQKLIHRPSIAKLRKAWDEGLDWFYEARAIESKEDGELAYVIVKHQDYVQGWSMVRMNGKWRLTTPPEAKRILDKAERARMKALHEWSCAREDRLSPSTQPGGRSLGFLDNLWD
jgi:hypothetical protein